MTNGEQYNRWDPHYDSSRTFFQDRPAGRCQAYYPSAQCRHHQSVSVHHGQQTTTEHAAAHFCTPPLPRRDQDSRIGHHVISWPPWWASQ